MRTNKFFSLAAIACGFALSFTACTGNTDNPIVVPEPQPAEPETVKATIGFEGATLNADGYWCGDETGTKFDNWGSEAFACTYVEDVATFNTNFTPSWASWMGYAISNRTETTYASETMTPDQFNNITGKAHGGKNFCVVQTYGETIDFGKPVTLKGFWYTNNAWTVDAILNGDGMTPGKFEAEDFLNCILCPTNANGDSGAIHAVELAGEGKYVGDWTYCDLSEDPNFENIVSLSFKFDGSKNNDWGLTTPAYVCIDDIDIEYQK